MSECALRTSVHACMRDVFAIYDDNILSRLIMIIIKLIILYFIQIRHTDDFSSASISAISTTHFAACVCVCVCVQNLTNFCPDALISTPNVPKILFA